MSSSLFCTNIAVVSGQEVLLKSIQGQENTKIIDQMRNSLMAPVQKLHDELAKTEQAFSALQKKGQGLAAELESGAKMLSKDAQQKKMDELKQLEEQAKDMAADLNRMAEKRNNAVKQADEKLKAKYQELMQGFNQEIDSIIQTTAAKEGWDVVLMKEQCVFVKESADHTKKIIDQLDASKRKNSEDATKKPVETKDKK